LTRIESVQFLFGRRGNSGPPPDQPLAFMPFDLSLAVKLGRFVDDAYAMQGMADPSKVVLNDPTYSLEQIIYGDDVWDDINGYVPFGFIAKSATAPYNLVISLRGTENLWDWLADASFIRRACPLAGAPHGAESEDGFTNLYLTLRTAPSAAAAPLKTTIKGWLLGLGAGNVAQVAVCGHSLGGALATLLAADLVGSGLVAAPVLYTLASPAVGEKTFATWCGSLLPDAYRIYNAPDVVPNVPPSLFGYTHVDEPYQINSGATTKINVGCHHSLDTYLHTLDSSQPLSAACTVGGGA